VAIQKKQLSATTKTLNWPFFNFFIRQNYSPNRQLLNVVWQTAVMPMYFSVWESGAVFVKIVICFAYGNFLCTKLDFWF